MKKLIVLMLVMSFFGCLLLASCAGDSNDPNATSALTTGTGDVTETTVTEGTTATEGTTESTTETVTVEPGTDVEPEGDLYDTVGWTKNY